MHPFRVGVFACLEGLPPRYMLSNDRQNTLNRESSTPLARERYSTIRLKIHDVVRVCFHRNKDLSFAVNGVDYGVAYSLPYVEHVLPIAYLCVQNSIEFCGGLEWCE
jgi:hypothetical protein